MMHDKICTYEVCKLAKEKGFNWDCPMFYTPEGKLKYGWAYDPMNSGLDMRDMLCHNSKLPLGFAAECTAPTQSLLQRWLREGKNIHIEIVATACGYFWIADKTNGTAITNSDILDRGTNEGGCFDTYELALEDALKYALNLV